MSNTGWAVVIILLIIILGGGWWWYSTQIPVTPATTGAAAADANTTTDTSTTTADVSADAGVNVSNSTTIHFTASGFAPKTVTIQKGQSVTWVDDTSGPMWVASASHPTHTAYDGTTEATHCSGSYTGPTPFDQCQGGSTYTFVFSKTGSFDFHNHLAAQFEGTVVVQ